MISVCIASYGTEEWYDRAWSHAYPSTIGQGAEVVVFHDRNGTVASTRNEAARQAHGDWLIFLDADDRLAEGYVEAMERALNGPALYLPRTSFVSFTAQNRVHPPQFMPDCSLRDGNPMIIGTMVPRQLFLDNGGFTENVPLYEDWMLFAQLWKRGAPIIKVPNAIYLAHMRRRSRNRAVRAQERTYWHQWIGHQVFPEHYEATRPEEDAARRLHPNFLRLRT